MEYKNLFYYCFLILCMIYYNIYFLLLEIYLWKFKVTDDCRLDKSNLFAICMVYQDCYFIMSGGIYEKKIY